MTCSTVGLSGTVRNDMQSALTNHGHLTNVTKPVLYRPGVMLTMLFVFALSACGSPYLPEITDIFSDPPPSSCPSVSILSNAERLTIFKPGDGRDIIDIRAELLIDDFIASCFDEVDIVTGKGQVRVDLSFGFTASRGAANQDGILELSYFITILDADKSVLRKSVFNIKTVFDGNRYRIIWYDEPVNLTIPINPPKKGSDYLIYIGFQLSPEQLKYNLRGG
jgi:hypothetical protein